MPDAAAATQSWCHRFSARQLRRGATSPSPSLTSPPWRNTGKLQVCWKFLTSLSVTSQCMKRSNLRPVLKKGVLQVFDKNEIIDFQFWLMKPFKRILGADHYFYNRTHRCVGPSRDLVWQIVKGRLVSEGKQEQKSVHLLLAGLENKRINETN